MITNPNHRYKLETWCAKNNVHIGYFDLADSSTEDISVSMSVYVVWIPKNMLPGELCNSCGGSWYNSETGTLHLPVYEKDVLEWLKENFWIACENTEVFNTWIGLLRFMISTKRKP